MSYSTSLTTTGAAASSSLTLTIPTREATLHIVLRQTQRTSIYERLFQELESIQSKFSGFNDVTSQLVLKWMDPVITAMRGTPLTTETITNEFLDEVFNQLIDLDFILRSQFDCREVNPFDFYNVAYANTVEKHEFAKETFEWMIKMVCELILSKKVITCDELTTRLEKSMQANQMAMEVIREAGVRSQKTIGEMTTMLNVATQQSKASQVQAAEAGRLSRLEAERQAAAFTELQTKILAQNERVYTDLRGRANKAEGQLQGLESAVHQLSVSNAANAQRAAAAEAEIPQIHAKVDAEHLQLHQEIHALQNRPPVVVKKKTCSIQ